MRTLAIVIGIGSYNDIGLIRSLGEAGIKSVYLYARPKLVFPIYHSRYVKEAHSIGENTADVEKAIQEINLRNKQSCIVVFPASDTAVDSMDELRDRLPDNVCTSHANGKIARMNNKLSMYTMAVEAGLPSPRTFVSTLANPAEVIGKAVIVKPVRSADGEKGDITICRAQDEYEKCRERLMAKGYREVLVQDYLHSESSREIGVTGVSMPGGEVVIHGYIDKIRNRSNINNFGRYHVATPTDVAEALKRYIKSTGYVGVFDTDFIEIDGQMHFIECNFRNGAYGYAVTAAGFNMPATFALGREVTGRLRNVTFMEERTDILNALDHTLTWGQWLRDVLRTDTFLWWNRRDPMPTLRHTFGKFFR